LDEMERRRRRRELRECVLSALVGLIVGLLMVLAWRLSL